MTIRPESGPLSAASRMKISNRAETAPNPYGGAGIRARSMPKGDRPIVLYPAYFDLGRTRDQGRRVAKRWAVESPTAQEVTAAAKALGLQPELEEGKAFPSTPWRKEGRVLVRADYYKTSIVQKVAKRIKESR
ncbi:MAG: signal recognition particle protein Srp19 [Methanobacteriota archaeon]|nr:MAG: signal recognition particle protein Srp19 [Euryarchaeota archaeon]